MASGYGLARIAEGGVHGWREGEARRDRATSRERADIQFEQGQEDRSFALGRRDVETARNDAEFDRKEANRQRRIKVNDALKGFSIDGDVEGMTAVHNEYGIEGVTYDIQKNDDGTYTRLMTKDGETESEIVDDDALGLGMMKFNDDDFVASLRKQQEKKSERKHDLAKLTKEYELKRGVEHVKGGYKVAAEGKGSAKTLPWQKELNDLAKEDYGSLFGDQWKFDTTREKAMRSAHAHLSSAYYTTEADGNTNAAHHIASRDMRKFLAMAENQAEEDVDVGDLDEKDKDNRVADIIDSLVSQKVKGMAPKPGDMIGRSEATAAPGKNAPPLEQFVEDSVQDLSGTPEAAGMTDDEIREAAREDYGTRFGGGAEEAPALERPTAEGEAAAISADTGGVSIPGISNAEAGEAPDLKRQKQADEDAATEESRREQQRSGMKPETLKRRSEKKAAENVGKQEKAKLARGSRKAKGEQATQLRRYRKLKQTARAKTMSKKQLGLALLAADSAKEKADIKQLLKQKAK